MKKLSDKINESLQVTEGKDREIAVLATDAKDTEAFFKAFRYSYDKIGAKDSQTLMYYTVKNLSDDDVSELREKVDIQSMNV